MLLATCVYDRHISLGVIHIVRYEKCLTFPLPANLKVMYHFIEPLYLPII